MKRHCQPVTFASVNAVALAEVETVHQMHLASLWVCAEVRVEGEEPCVHLAEQEHY